MNQELKAKWIAALRSGEWKQGQDVLRDHKDRYCCLGVLHQLASGKKPSRYWAHSDRAPASDECDRPDETLLPSKVIRALVGMNDGGKSFAEIADYIEAHL